jgi:hypothetical protein
VLTLVSTHLAHHRAPWPLLAAPGDSGGDGVMVVVMVMMMVMVMVVVVSQ